MNVEDSVMNIRNEETKLLTSHGNDFFGQSVAISSDGNTAIVGAYYDNDRGRGSAYIYIRSGDKWNEHSKLIASDGASPDYFGWSVAISGDGNTVIVGAMGDDNEKGINAGSAYIYTRNDSGWVEKVKLLASDGADGDNFGMSVSISSDGNTAIVGAHGDDSYRGSAYIYTRTDNGWVEEAKLLASDGVGFDNFGRSVSISSDGNTAIVGARLDYNENDDNAGSAYIYTRSGDVWVEEVKLLASDGSSNDQFGYSVFISGDGNTVIVGAIGDDNEKGTNAGSAYIYTRTDNGWIEEAKLLASDSITGDQFGWSVSTLLEIDSITGDSFGWSVSISDDGNTVIVGTYIDDIHGDRTGGAYIYTRSNGTWGQKVKLLASDGSNGDMFGSSVAISGDGDTAIVGAHFDHSENGDVAGSAYIFDLT